jgi:hypothetical protein
MPFGKYKGQPLEAIPTSYLDWLLRSCDLNYSFHLGVEDELRHRAEEIGIRSREPSGNLPANLPRIVQQWYRGLVMDYHPDRGGDTRAMQALNDAHDRLKRLVGMAG